MALLKHPAFLLILALVAGLITGFYPVPALVSTADTLAMIFVNLLKLISLPLIFLAIVSTITQMADRAELRLYGGTVLKYTLLTTVIAASIGLALFLWLNPVGLAHEFPQVAIVDVPQGSYYDYLIASIPSNIIKPFSEGNVIAVLLLALLFSFATIHLPEAQKTFLNTLFTSLFAAILQIARAILKFIPLAIWAFITQFVVQFQSGDQLASLAVYLACVLFANLIQAVFVLPLFLKFKGLSPWKTLKAMSPALNVAFWSKSSAATLPVTLQCATERLGLSRKTAGFSLPLCTAINMNGCAAFIVITVLFVSMCNGVVFSPFEFAAWVFIATLAAFGNAGVPMGCYFLSLALLTAMNVPLNLMFVILPFYAFLDMLETAINVWSDACVTAVVDKDVGSNQD
jgi:Na+/H+-dicarboxylate symporter